MASCNFEISNSGYCLTYQSETTMDIISKKDSLTDSVIAVKLNPPLEATFETYWVSNIKIDEFDETDFKQKFLNFIEDQGKSFTSDPSSVSIWQIVKTDPLSKPDNQQEKSEYHFISGSPAVIKLIKKICDPIFKKYFKEFGTLEARRHANIQAGKTPLNFPNRITFNGQPIVFTPELILKMIKLTNGKIKSNKDLVCRYLRNQGYIIKNDNTFPQFESPSDEEIRGGKLALDKIEYTLTKIKAANSNKNMDKLSEKQSTFYPGYVAALNLLTEHFMFSDELPQIKISHIANHNDLCILYTEIIDLISSIKSQIFLGKFDSFLRIRSSLLIVCIEALVLAMGTIDACVKVIEVTEFISFSATNFSNFTHMN